MSEMWERVSAARHAYQHSVEDVPSAQRLNIWRDLIAQRQIETVGELDPSELRGRIIGQVFEGGALAHWTLSAQKIIRTPKVADRLDDEYVFVSVIIDGVGGVENLGQELPLGPGEFVIVDGTKPFAAYTTSDVATRGFVHLKKEALRQRLGRNVDVAFGAYRKGHPLQQLAYSFLFNLTGLVGLVEPSTLRSLSEQALDVIALLANERRPGSADPSTHQSAMLLRLKLNMKDNLRNLTYSIDMAAASLGVTPRHVNSLLALEGTSFGRRLLAARLDGAHRQITDPRNVHRQIVEIAFDWGFNNASHFGRVYKDKFGVTPREAKMAGMFNVIENAA